MLCLGRKLFTWKPFQVVFLFKPNQSLNNGIFFFFNNSLAFVIYWRACSRADSYVYQWMLFTRCVLLGRLFSQRAAWTKDWVSHGENGEHFSVATLTSRLKRWIFFFSHKQTSFIWEMFCWGECGMIFFLWRGEEAKEDVRELNSIKHYARQQ